jgi:hypothetical protein
VGIVESLRASDSGKLPDLYEKVWELWEKHQGEGTFAVAREFVVSSVTGSERPSRELLVRQSGLDDARLARVGRDLQRSEPTLFRRARVPRNEQLDAKFAADGRWHQLGRWSGSRLLVAREMLAALLDGEPLPDARAVVRNQPTVKLATAQRYLTDLLSGVQGIFAMEF